MLLGYADVKEAVFVIRAEFFKTGTESHCRSDKANSFVFCRHFAHELAELAAECYSLVLGLTGIYIKIRNSVIKRGIFFRKIISLALDCVDVQKNRTGYAFCRIQCLAHLIYVVTVNRAHIPYAHILKHGAFIYQIFNMRF